MEYVGFSSHYWYEPWLTGCNIWQFGR